MSTTHKVDAHTVGRANAFQAFSPPARCPHRIIDAKEVLSKIGDRFPSVLNEGAA